MDAWKNGGQFEGKPVGDANVLAYWNKRLAGLSPRDPSYDQLKSNILQLNFAIEDSKSDLAYKQGKITAQQRAQFFLDWAAKVPKDSELWRTLQKNAAQFMQAVKSASSASSSKAAADARDAADAATQAQYEEAANFLSDVIDQAAQSLDLVAHEKINADGKVDWTAIDPASIPQLLSALNRTTWVTDYLKQIDPSFTGTITQAYLSSVFTSKMTGIQQRLLRARQANATTDVTKILKEMATANATGRLIGAWGTDQHYEQARNLWLEVWQDPTATADAKLAAYQQYATTLRDIASDPTTDPAMAAAIIAEVGDGVSVPPDPTKTSLHEDWGRYKNPNASKDPKTDQPNGDIADTLASLEQAINDATAVANGTGVYVTGSLSGNGTFTPGAGSAVGVEQTVAVTGIPGAEPVPVVQPDGTVAVVYVVPKTVTVVYRDTATGKPLPAAPGTSAVVSQVYDLPNGQRIYTYTDDLGVVHYTPENPWADGAKIITTGNGVTVDVTNLIQTTTTPDGKTYFDPNQAWNEVKSTAGVNYATDTQTLTSAVLRDMPADQAKVIIDAIQQAGKAGSPAYNAILASLLDQTGQLDPAKAAEWTSTLAGGAQPYGPQGPVAVYDNTNNRKAFSDPNAPVQIQDVIGQQQVTTYTQGPGRTVQASTAWEPITGTMTVPGRFGTPLQQLPDGRWIPWMGASSTSETREGLKPIKFSGQITVPSVAPIPGLVGPKGPDTSGLLPPVTSYNPPGLLPNQTVQDPDVKQLLLPPLPVAQPITKEDLKTPGATTRTSGGVVGF